MRFELIMPNAIDTIWPLVKEGLNAIEKKDAKNEPDNILKAALKANPEVRLYFVWEGDEYQGFFIIKINRYHDHKELCAFKGYKIPEARGSLVQCYNEMELIAKELGCSEIAFYSHRKGFERRFKGMGFKKGYTQYIREVGNG